MATPVFKLTAADAALTINPTSKAGYFVVGSAPGQVPSAVIEKVLNNFEARVLSSIPEKWRMKTDRFEGVIAVRWATEGQNTFTLPVAAKNDLQVFVNYPGIFGNGMKVFGATQKPYGSRTALDATIGCTLDGTNTIVTLPIALAEGDHVIVDYNHDSMDECLELKMCVLEMTAAELLRGMPGLGDNVSDKVNTWELNAYTFLKRLWNGENNYRTGLQFFDRIKFINEMETRISGGTRNTGIGMGGLLL